MQVWTRIDNDYMLHKMRKPARKESTPHKEIDPLCFKQMTQGKKKRKFNIESKIKGTSMPNCTFKVINNNIIYLIHVLFLYQLSPIERLLKEKHYFWHDI